MKKPETRFKERIRPYLEALPKTYVVKIQQVTLRGIPDFFLIINGTAVVMELKKSNKEKLDSLQQWNIMRARKAGGVGLICYPENWNEVYQQLKELAWRNAPSYHQD